VSRELVRLDSPDGAVVRVVEDGGVVGEVRARGAQVTRWRPAGAQEVLFAGAHHQEPGERVVHGGVPVCVPWFANGPSGDLKPTHGPARLVGWTETGTELVDGTLVTRWSLDAAALEGADGEEHVPPGLVAALVAELGPDAMSVTLEVRSTAAEPVTVEMALHTYLRVGDVTQVRVQGLDGARYLDKVASASQGAPVHTVQDGDVVVDGEVDRVYEATGVVMVEDPVLHRVIEVAKSGSGTTVVWNPAAHKGAALTDLAEGEWRECVCVESANAGETAVTIAPGATHAMTQRVSLR